MKPFLLTDAAPISDQIRIESPSGINEGWVAHVESLIENQPRTASREEWIGITRQLLDVILLVTTNAPTRSSAPSSLRFDEKPKRGEVPFDIGLQLLQGAPLSCSADSATKEAVTRLESDVQEIETKLAEADQSIVRLQQRVHRWKSLAKTRLLELWTEFESRERAITLQ